MNAVGRFAPSTTGPPHPGTLLAALLCWLDIRSRGGHLLLRLEDLDPERAKPRFSGEMLRALEWLGLDWDGLERQSENLERYPEALDFLGATGRLYPCSCSRRAIREAGGTISDGTPRYPGTCRERSLPSGGWRSSSEPLRLRCDPPEMPVRDEDGTELPAEWAGDPLLRRRDGAFGYHLASVVDDAARGVNRVVRGRDLAGSTAPQWAVQEFLELPRPAYRHHLLLLERRGHKLAKLHGSVGWEALRAVLGPEQVVGQLAALVGLRAEPRAVRAAELVTGFAWNLVSAEDRLVSWEAGPPGSLQAR